MVDFDKNLLLLESNRTGFKPEIIEKVLHLINLLNEIFDHSFLKKCFALKGGTALNLFYFDLPRLSVDIDLNYIGSLDRKAMLEERKEVESILINLCRRLGYEVKRSATEHAGGKWRFAYRSAMNQMGNIEVDISYMYRTLLWPVQYRTSATIGNNFSKNIPVLDIHELGAGKLSALFSRNASRDLFDTHHLLVQYNENQTIDMERLRTSFVVYGAMAKKDWREISLDDITFNPSEFENKLLTVMSKNKQISLDDWSHRLVKECKNMLGMLLPFKENERAFFDALLDFGEIKPEYVANGQQLQNIILNHPGILWKALNVKQYKLRGNA